MYSFTLFWSFFLSCLNFRVRSVTLQMLASKRIRSLVLQRLRSPNESRTTSQGSQYRLTALPSVSLSHPSIQSHSLWLNLFFVALQTIKRLCVNLSGGRVVESATVWNRHNCWEIYIFWQQKKDRLFYTRLMWLSVCFSNLRCWGSATDRSELLFLATNLSQTLKMCC